MKEPWCLAVSDPKASARKVMKYYAKRWGVECGFRDTKDIRFGLAMSSVHIGATGRRDPLNNARIATPRGDTFNQALYSSYFDQAYNDYYSPDYAVSAKLHSVR